MTGNTEVPANDLDEVRIALGGPDGGHVADEPKEEARDPKAQTDAECSRERAVENSDGAWRSTHQDRFGQRAMHGRDESSFPEQAPQAVVYPNSTEDVADIVRVCARHGTPIVPFGAGTSLEGHILPARAGITGWVQVEVLVNADGSVRSAKVVDAKPKGMFEAAAMTAVLRWKFKPKVLDGKPVDQRGQCKIEFNLNAPSPA